MFRNLPLPLLALLLLTGAALAQNQCAAGTPLIGSFPYIENFDSLSFGTTPPTDWIQDSTDSGGNSPFFADWTFRMGTPPSGFPAGPSGDATTGTGTYAYVEDAGARMTVNLLTPCFDFSKSRTGSSGGIRSTWNARPSTSPGRYELRDSRCTITCMRSPSPR